MKVRREFPPSRFRLVCRVSASKRKCVTEKNGMMFSRVKETQLVIFHTEILN
jgi:hypothetical protein